MSVNTVPEHAFKRLQECDGKILQHYHEQPDPVRSIRFLCRFFIVNNCCIQFCAALGRAGGTNLPKPLEFPHGIAITVTGICGGRSRHHAGRK